MECWIWLMNEPLWWALQIWRIAGPIEHFDGLVQERRNSIGNALTHRFCPGMFLLLFLVSVLRDFIIELLFLVSVESRSSPKMVQLPGQSDRRVGREPTLHRYGIVWVLVASLMSLTAFLVTTSRTQQCFNVMFIFLYLRSIFCSCIIVVFCRK